MSRLAAAWFPWRNELGIDAAGTPADELDLMELGERVSLYLLSEQIRNGMRSRT